MTDKRRAEAREIWLKACKKQGVTLARCTESAVYAWLYRNDRSWLLTNNELARLPRPAAKRVNWDERDRELSNKIEEVARLLASGTTKQLTLGAIFRILPELKPKLDVIENLPRTEMALRKIVRLRRRHEEDLFQRD
jgi:hypothetical protein